MKKILAIFIVVLFLVSLVPVFAEDSNNSDEGTGDVSTKNELSREQVKETNKINRELLKQKAEQLKERIQEAKDKFKEAKDKLVEARRSFAESREDLRNKTKEVTDFCKKNKGTECEQKKEDFVKTSAKTYLLNTINKIENALDQRVAKINELLAKPNVTNTEVLQTRLTEISQDKAKLAEFKAQLENATTKDQVKTVAAALKDEWKSIKDGLELSRGDILSHRFEFAVERSEELQKNLDKALEKMKAKGLDVANVQAKVDSFNAHIANAKDLVEQARAKFADSSLDRATAAKTGHELLVEAQKELNAAHGDLKSIVSLVKAQKEDVTELAKSKNETESSDENASAA